MSQSQPQATPPGATPPDATPPDATPSTSVRAGGPSAATPGRAGDAGRTSSLWRDANFLTLWSGQALAQVGSQVTELAIPVLAVLLLQASEFEVGVLGAAGVAAFLVVGLPAGAWIDRLRKRRVMIWADAVRAVALLVVPVLWWADVLAMWHLVLVALVVGVATVFFDVSYQSLIPSLVRPSQIAEANGKLEATGQLANIAGPAVGGWLIGAIMAPLAIVATVATYLASFVALLLTRDHEVPRAADDRAPIGREIAEGLRWVFGNPLLRRIVGTTGISNFFSTMSFTLLPIFLLRELGLSPVEMGIILSLGSVGGLAGAIATPHIVRRLGEARAIPVSAIAFGLAALVLPLAAAVPTIAFPLLVAQLFVGSFAVLVYNITQVTFRQRITPTRLLGRMNASVRFCVWGVMPIAALLAGGLGTWIGVVPTLWAGAAGQLLSTLCVVIGPFWLLRRLPDGGS
ncbi:MFS transporter [Agrococcus sp. Ld7]|uniref:MFS transporter n=1 Tax=Agrococcus sp. Ld7 TaxID=649148 RepID=UPI003865DE52